MAELTVIVTTRNRPELLKRAVESALMQGSSPVDVIVVDDASDPPASPDPRARLIRLPERAGSAVARNTGVRAAATRWVSFLDDDDALCDNFACVSLAALAHATVEPPVAVLSALVVVDESGAEVRTHVPPTLAKGGHFGLEDIPSEYSYYSKQTLVVERELLLSLGGFDETISARDFTDLLLRLSPVCSIIGVPDRTLRHHRHAGPRISSDVDRRLHAFDTLVTTHEAAMASHPRGFARLLIEHATTLSAARRRREALQARSRAVRVAPIHAVLLLASPRRRRQ